MAEYKIKGDTQRMLLHEVIPLDTPMRVFLEGASACNFRCFFCFHNTQEYNKNINEIMPLELAQNWIDDLKMFPRKIKLLSFSANGESLLNKKLPEMIDYAKQSGITEKIDFTTNASLLTHETTNRLIAAGVDRIHISIYGLSENQYYKVTSHKLNFSELIENIGYLYQNKKQCVITVKICDVAYETVQDEQKFYEIFSTICDSFSIEQIVPASYDVKYNDYIASKNIDIYGKTRVHKKICPPIFYSMSIHPDGSVSPCCPDWNKKLIVGNANTESLKKIWNGQNYYELQHNQLKDGRRSVPICARCEIPEFFMLDNIDEYREIILNRLEHVKMCSNNRSRNK